MLDDQRSNQLDELQTQISSSGSQSQVRSVESQSVLADLTGVVNDACEAVFRVPSAPVSSAPSSNEDSLLSQDSAMVDPHLCEKESFLPHQIPDRVAGKRLVILAPISHLVLPLLLVWLAHGLPRVHGLFLVRDPLHSIPDGCLSVFPAFFT